MKRSLLVVLLLVAVMVLGMMGGSLLRVQAASKIADSIAVSTSIVPRVVNVKVDGIITIWADAPGFNGPKVQALHTSAKLVQNPTRGFWTITMANLFILWDSRTALTLQDGKVASGVFLPPTNAASLVIPLKGIPLINTITFSLSTNSSVTTTNNQVIHGSPLDLKGNLNLVGSKSFGVLFETYHAQISIQCKLSPLSALTNLHR